MKINILTLGCSKNTVDSEVLATYLAKGNEIVFDSPLDSADAVIINTCGFILDSKQESIDYILDALEAKQEGLLSKVYVMGCLVERYKKELPAELPEVDGFFGVNDLPDILKTFDIDYKKELFGERLLSTPSHYAYLKISEGCDRSCAFCAIPLIRGKHKSVPMEEVISRAKNLRNQGVQELILIAQDSTYYGRELYGEPKIAELLDNLSQIDFPWIRLHYMYPSSFPKDLIDVMAGRENIVKYVDIPFQHASDKVLKMMRRGHGKDKIYELVEAFRTKMPDVAIRTTLIVGHPGEGEKEFQELYDFVEEMKFDRLGVFPYSHEENTYGGEHYDDEVPDEIKQERLDAIMTLQEKISLEKNQAKEGKVFDILIDRREGEYFVGRTQYDSPEVDNEVLVSSDDLETGKFYKIKITDAAEYDLFGEVVKQ